MLLDMCDHLFPTTDWKAKAKFVLHHPMPFVVNFTELTAFTRKNLGQPFIQGMTIIMKAT